MEQHAIPQQISNYEFKLVGDMTLKQFLKAAAGIVLAQNLWWGWVDAGIRPLSGQTTGNVDNVIFEINLFSDDLYLQKNTG